MPLYLHLMNEHIYLPSQYRLYTSPETFKYLRPPLIDVLCIISFLFFFCFALKECANKRGQRFSHKLGVCFRVLTQMQHPKIGGPKQEQNKWKKAKVLPKIRTRKDGKIYIRKTSMGCLSKVVEEELKRKLFKESLSNSLLSFLRYISVYLSLEGTTKWSIQSFHFSNRSLHLVVCSSLC